jgi:hypothetical protein
MKYGTYIVTACAVVALVWSGQYAARSCFSARQLKAQSDILAVRNRIMKHQAGELEQKMRVLQRVKHFVDRAVEQRLSPDSWSTYEVNIQDAITYRELAQIVEQCVHNTDLYFKPIAFHATLDEKDNKDPKLAEALEPVVLDTETLKDTPSDVALVLKGTFLVRQ